jgi:DNA-binding transcriptional MerR regulator
MYKIGEFAQIAQVSGRLLRYYDSIGLLSPVRIDPATGYRHYAAQQLADLNRILALKELGLTLDQVGRLMRDGVSAEEIRGMLALRKAELERSLSEEAVRLRQVESRLRQIDEQGQLADYDVVVKSAPARPYLSLRREFSDMDEAVAALRNVVEAATAKVPESTRDALVVVAHSAFEHEHLDLEIGFTLHRDLEKTIAVPGGSMALKPTELPALPALATLVRRGPNYTSHLAFGALGVWMEANSYTISGPSREVFLELPFRQPDQDESVVEIQFPVARAA